MQVSVVAKNTFVHVTSREEQDFADAGLPRCSSCPSLVASRATSPECAHSEGPTVTPLSNLGSWADLDSDSEDERHPACFTSAVLNGYAFTDAVNPTTTWGDKAPAPGAPGGARPPECVRTPLSRSASAFVPSSSLHDKAPAFRPWPGQAVSDASDSLVHGVQWQGAIGTHANTTVVIRGLPHGSTREGLLKILNKEGFAGLYTFLYMPMDFETNMCIGYVFVNLTDEEQAQNLIATFDGRPHHQATYKCCSAELSRTQGLAANIERYRNSPVMGSEVPDCFKPVLFAGGQRVPFPEPTRCLPEIVRRARPQ